MYGTIAALVTIAALYLIIFFSIRGINYVLDLFDFQLGCFKSGEKIRNESNLPDIMALKWHGLVIALTREWRNTITREASENIAVLLKDLKTKQCIIFFVKRILKSSNAQESICRKLNIEITGTKFTL